jgi:hypothetical protein
MEINRHNYEIWLIDYIDGKLSAEQVRLLMIFLQENPDIQEEFDGLEMTSAIPDADVRFDRKEELRKPEDVEIPLYQQWMIDKMEGNLAARDEQRLEEYLVDNVQAQKEMDAFLKTKMVPEMVFFPNREMLKRDEMDLLSREDYLLAAQAEGKLTEAEQKEWNGLLQNRPHLKLSLDFILNAKLSPDLEVVFPNRASLKHRRVLSITPTFKWMAAAAVFIVALMIYLTNKTEYSTTTANSGIANNMGFEWFKNQRPVNDSATIPQSHSLIPLNTYAHNPNIAINSNQHSSQANPDPTRKMPLLAAEIDEKKALPEIKSNQRYFVVPEQAQEMAQASPVQQDFPGLGQMLFHSTARYLDAEQPYAVTAQAAEKNKRFRALNVFYWGVKGISKLTGSDSFTAERSFSDDGQISNIHLQAGPFEIARSAER